MNVYDPDNLMSAVTLNRVLEETLRLTPALYFLPRRATVDTWLETTDQRKMFIPKGTQLRLDVWHANRCEEFWGKAVTGYPAESFAHGPLGSPRQEGNYREGDASLRVRALAAFLSG